MPGTSRLLLPLLLLGAPLVAGAAHAQAPSPADTDRNVELLARYYDLGRRGDLEGQVVLWAKDASNNGERVRADDIRAALEDIRRTFPDYDSVVLEMRAIGDTVVALSRISGTHKGTAQTRIFGGLLQGVKPTGKRFEVLATHWWRFRDGKIAWHQVTRDDLGILHQLGLVADPSPTDRLQTARKE